MKNILVINAHPRKGSLSDGITDAYLRGLKETNHEVKHVNLRDLTFDPILRNTYRNNELEDDLKKMQEHMLWCNHLVIITPVWWMSMPALLKGFFDRVLTPRFAFQYTKGSLLPFPKRLLKGRSCRVIYTQGGPGYLTTLLGFDAFWKALKFGTLLFCGFGPVRRTAFTAIAGATEQKCNSCIKKAYRLGTKGK